MARSSAPTLLARRAAAGQFDDEVLAWLQAGFRRFLDGGEIEFALKLDRPSRVRQRNAALRRLAEVLGDGRGLWPQAERMEDAISWFASERWPALQKTVMPPEDQLGAALFAAFASRVRVPAEQRGLYNVLKST